MYSQSAKFVAQMSQHSDVLPINVDTVPAAMECDDDKGSASARDSAHVSSPYAMRMWWASCKTSDVSMNDELIGVAETDFVSARQKSVDENLISVANELGQMFLHSSFSLLGDPASRLLSDCFRIAESAGYHVDGDDFHNWLTLSRLCAVATGSNIDINIWRYIRCLELIRHCNLQVSLGGASLFQ